jgi:F-type H+-transporting ATPase subunit b
MLIDWFTVGAQALNFLILVWLLKRFLYKPILGAIDAREKRFAAELADADAKRAEAQRMRDDFQGKSKAFDDQRGALLSKASDAAKAEGARLLDEARKEADGLRTRLGDALRGEQLRLSGEITRMAQDEVFAIARKALSDLASVSLEERMGEVFTRRLGNLDGKTRETLASALRETTEPAVIQSTFELPENQKAAIQNALNVAFSSEVRVRFETARDAVCGIEMTAKGQKVGWSIADYLASLDKKVVALLKEQSVPAPGVEPKMIPAVELAPATNVKAA